MKGEAGRDEGDQPQESVPYVSDARNSNRGFLKSQSFAWKMARPARHV
jgi:hypothetical protein